MKKNFARQAMLQKMTKSLGAKSSESEADMTDMNSSSVDRILAKRKKMSEGGVVANETEVTADEMPNEFDDLVLDDHLDAHVDADFNEHGDAQESKDREDMISRIMRQRKMKQSNPKPA